MNNNEMKINAYKNFYNNGIWDNNILDYLKLKNIITQDEYMAIISQPKSVKDRRISDEPYMYELWDKKSPINGVPAEEMLKDNTLKNASAVILIKSPYSENNNVLYVESVDVLKNNYKLRSMLSPEEVAEFQIDYLTSLENKPEINYEQVSVGMDIYNRALQTDKLDTITNLLTDIKNILLNK